jgi:hypothetical protein
MLMACNSEWNASPPAQEEAGAAFAGLHDGELTFLPNEVTAEAPQEHVCS